MALHLTDTPYRKTEMTQFTEKPGNATQADEARLSAVLKGWHAVETSPEFDQAVWARIRHEAVTVPPRLTVIDFLRQTLAQPAWAAAAAAVIGLGMGVTVALVSPRPATAGTQAERLLQRDTLAGSYLAMTTGALR